MTVRRWSSWKLGSCKLVSWKKPDARVLTFNFPMVARTLKMKRDVTAAMWAATRPGTNISPYVIIIHANITIANNSCTYILYIYNTYNINRYERLLESFSSFRENCSLSQFQVIRNTFSYRITLHEYSTSFLFYDTPSMRIRRKKKENS